MKKIKCMIIDDEPPAIALLEKYAQMVSHLEVVGTSQSAIKAFDEIDMAAVDLLLLDIRMPVLNGIDFIKTLKNPPAVIITTAYREHALEGYDLDIVDYLLKPIAFDRFLKAINRYKDRTQGVASELPIVQPVKAEKEYTYFKVNKTNHKVHFADIQYIESLKDYVSVHFLDSRLIVKGNLGTIMKQLPESIFLRIHRSFAIAIPAVQSYNQSQVQVSGKQLPIGISYRDEVVKVLGL